MSNIFDLEGKVAIVTGASTGIGQAIARALATAGARIVGVSRSSMELTRQQIEDSGGAFSAVMADLSAIEPFEHIIEAAASWGGAVDVLVNNAGVIRRDDPLNFSERDWDEVINLDLKAVFFLSQAFARRVVAQGSSAKIINIASVLSFQGGIRVPSYAAAKAGVAGLTRLLACEWAPKGINVNAIAPGYCVTDATEPLWADAARNEAILARIPAGRWGRPDDIAGAAVFLASRAADYCHGTILVVDGGWLAR